MREIVAYAVILAFRQNIRIEHDKHHGVIS
jgi:hypothetical protein